ncbi:unnamed protein product [Heterobilharzia americana]|nr:unnamed protein product [Heterobilharzia americana]
MQLITSKFTDAKDDIQRGKGIVRVFSDRKNKHSQIKNALTSVQVTLPNMCTILNQTRGLVKWILLIE